MAADEQGAVKVIRAVKYITIATVSAEGLPWNSPMFAAYDDDFVFYFGTDSNSQKAQNIRSNPEVFVVIYDSTAPPGTGEGVYIRGKACEVVDDKELVKAHKLLCGRDEVSYWKLDEVQGNAPIRLFKIIPETIWMNDEGSANGHYVDTRKGLNIGKLIKESK